MVRCYKGTGHGKFQIDEQVLHHAGECNVKNSGRGTDTDEGLYQVPQEHWDVSNQSQPMNFYKYGSRKKVLMLAAYINITLLVSMDKNG